MPLLLTTIKANTVIVSRNLVCMLSDAQIATMCSFLCITHNSVMISSCYYK